jgi:hypothetical protein
MNQVRFLLIVVILFCAANASAQRNRNKANVAPVDLRKIDTLLQPIPNKRSLFHLYIDDQLVLVDKLDGRYDGEVSNYRGPMIDGVITNDILRRAKSLSAFIENQKFNADEGVDHNTKVRYLRKVEFNLKDFYSDMYDGSVEINLYKNMFEILEGIIIANKEGKLKEYAESNADMGLYVNRSLIEDKPELMNILINAMCNKYPALMEDKLYEIAQYDGACNVMANIAKRDIGRVYSAATSTNFEHNIVAKCQDPLVKGIYELSTKTPNEFKTRALVFLNDYVKGKRTINDIQNIISNDENYYKSLVQLRQDESISDKNKINKDLRFEAYKYVRTINDLHDVDDLSVRFKALENFTAQELYYMPILCSDEMYTSSFTKGIFRLIKEKMQVSGDQYLASLKEDRFRTFIRICANYNTLDTFLATMPAQQGIDLMDKFVSNLGANNPIDLEGSTDVADAIGSINNMSIIDNLQDKVREEYESNYLKSNKEGLSVYFILYTLLNSKYENYDDSTFDAILTSKLRMQPINKMPFARMVSEGSNAVYEQMFFYGDKDGQDSYNNFKGFVNKFTNLKLDESNKYWTKISAIDSKVPFEIYANKPLKEPEDEEAQKQLNEHLIANNINPSIIVHRGHSYHLPTTLSYLTNDNKVIILGSCGGYQNLSTILGRSEDAQIVSTKQVGTMHVTDPILREVHASVMNGQEINWTTIWNKLDKEMTSVTARDFFNDYVPPHKNLGALFLKAYKTLSNTTL